MRERGGQGLGGDEAAVGAELARLLEVVDAVLAEGDVEAGPRGGGGGGERVGARRVAAGVRDGALGDDVVVVGAGEERGGGRVEERLVGRRGAVEERHLDAEHCRGHRPRRLRRGCRGTHRRKVREGGEGFGERAGRRSGTAAGSRQHCSSERLGLFGLQLLRRFYRAWARLPSWAYVRPVILGLG